MRKRSMVRREMSISGKILILGSLTVTVISVYVFVYGELKLPADKMKKFMKKVTEDR